MSEETEIKRELAEMVNTSLRTAARTSPVAYYAQAGRFSGAIGYERLAELLGAVGAVVPNRAVVEWHVRNSPKT